MGHLGGFLKFYKKIIMGAQSGAVQVIIGDNGDAGGA
jgi:hypothetical protein